VTRRRRGHFGGRVRPPSALRREAPVHPAWLVIGGVASVQVGAALAKHLFGALGPGGTVTLRLGTAAGVLALVARPRVRGLTGRQVRLVLAFGATLAAMNLSFYASIARIPLGIAVTVEFVGPLAVAVLGTRRRLDLLWAALAAVGVVLLTGGVGALRAADGLDVVGVALAALAGIGWSGYILLSQRVGAALPGVQGLALAVALAALLVLPVGLVQGGAALLRPDLLLTGVGVGILSSALPWVLETTALRTLSASTFGVLMSLEPAVAALVGLALLQEQLTTAQWTAIGLTCAASAGAALSAGGRRSPPGHGRLTRAGRTVAIV